MTSAITGQRRASTDLRNLSVNMVDQQAVIDGALISSRSYPDAFCSAVVERFATGAGAS